MVAQADLRQGPARPGPPRHSLLPALRHRPVRPRAGAGLRDGCRPLGLRAVPADVRSAGGRGRLLVWTTTPWTLVSNTAVAANPDVTYVVAAPDGSERLVVAEPLLESPLGEGWTVGPVLRRTRPGALDATSAHSTWSTIPERRALRGARRLRHDRGRHRASCTRRPRSAPTTSPSAGPTACRSSTRSAATAPSPRRPPGRRPVLQEGRRATRRRPAGTRPAVPARALRAQLSALLALPHGAHLLRAAVVVHPHDRASRTRCCAENEQTNWYPGQRQVGPLRRLAAQQHRLGAVAHPLLGHSAADLALRRRAT